MDPTQLNTIFNGGFTGEISGDYGVPFPGGNYDCGRCHTTGYRFDNTGPEPATYNGTPITDAQFSRYPTDYTTGTSSWYLTSIQCERCHRDVANEAGGHNCYIGGPTYTYSVAQYGTNINGSYNAAYVYSWSCWAAGGSWTVVVPTFQQATALCIECHRQESADTTNNVITLTTDLMVSDGGSCSDGTSPDYATCLANSATWNWAPFFDASAGQTFLNSPHSRFSGTIAQNVQNSPDLSVSMTGSYSSNFRDSESGLNNGCNGCHDVHQSTVEAVGATAPISTRCADCHTGTAGNAPKVDLAYINHRSGVGTPLENQSTDPSSPCIICHMPDAYHLMRISHDPNYSTFPTAAQFYVGQQTTANTASDGILADAVWNDLGLACGQCHGGGTSPTDNPPLPNVPWESTATLASVANGIHNAIPDLAVSSLLVTNDAAKTQKTTTTSAGSTVYITDNTTNIGGGAANASTTAFYVSTTTSLTNQVAKFACADSIPALAPGTANSATTTTCVIPSVAPGTYYVVANADDTNTSGETNKSNNTRAFGPISIVANNVDLAISASSYVPSGAKRGTSISVTDIVLNLQSGTAGPSQTGIYLMTSCPAPSATPPPLASQIGTRSVPSISGGGSNSGTTSVTIPLTAPVGTNYIVFYADWQNAVAETNETNNARCKAITLL